MGLRLDCSKNTLFYSCPHHNYSKFKVCHISPAKIYVPLTNVFACESYLTRKLEETFCWAQIASFMGVLDLLAVVCLYLLYLLYLCWAWIAGSVGVGVGSRFLFGFPGIAPPLSPLSPPPCSTKYRHHQTLNIIAIFFKQSYVFQKL